MNSFRTAACRQFTLLQYKKNCSKNRELRPTRVALATRQLGLSLITWAAHWFSTGINFTQAWNENSFHGLPYVAKANTNNYKSYIAYLKKQCSKIGLKKFFN